MRRKKLILGVTLGGSSRLLDGQPQYFKNLGYDVFLTSQEHTKGVVFCEKEGISYLPVTIDKEINPLLDIKTLFQLIKHFRKVKPEVVNLGTPKMGLLGILAATIVGIEKRVYTCRGHRYETEAGFKRKILMWVERLTAKCATDVIYVSKSLYNNALINKLAYPEKSHIIGEGSSNGIDIEFFNRNAIDTAKQNELIQNLNLKEKFVIGFVGRISLHKGVYELIEAFEDIYENHTNSRLILMGHIDCDGKFEERFRSHPGIIHIPFQDDVPLYMSLFDIFVLPSWREGFPNVPIQAAAMGLPVIVSDATGCVDSVEDNVNGIVFPCKNPSALKAALESYIENPSLIKKHGENGLKWAGSFSQKRIWNGINEIYKL
ncbi:glycosyltransferase family 4 protein [Aequorivita marina]|uniref:glycosyltransferase family 4 protein n=1 Tax=Aequorivita marina TaxID=3073654 RepID=UPI0028746B90|nr:glycosyltransferase family 4 protein [Aequorivita sp. S2608]MDS1299047.1 glycosyltransferase family 4 protein [Aequorivita sp. S2608]